VKLELSVRIAIVFLLVVLGGCASQSPQIAPVPKPFVDRVEPLAIELLEGSNTDLYLGYVLPLSNNLGGENFYQLLNGPQLLHEYVYSHQIEESDPNKTVFAFKAKAGSHWGYITTGIGREAIANAFLIENKQVGVAYALVLKRLKLCLVTQSEGLPVYNGQRWNFPDKPGYFECTGMTNKNIFRVGTGLPTVLGPYYEEKDTILVFRQFSELQQVVQSLKQQFPYLSVPVIYKH
jgi:hypothetical protein